MTSFTKKIAIYNLKNINYAFFRKEVIKSYEPF